MTIKSLVKLLVHLRNKLSARDLSKITEYVKPHSHKWKEIGQGLGFTADELSNIEARLTLLIGAPYSYPIAMLSDWWHWAPGDARGSTNYATLDSLKTAKAGIRRWAQELCNCSIHFLSPFPPFVVFFCLFVCLFVFSGLFFWYHIYSLMLFILTTVPSTSSPFLIWVCYILCLYHSRINSSSFGVFFVLFCFPTFPPLF